MKKVKENKSRSESKVASSSKKSNWVESKVEEPVLDLKVNPIIIPGNTNKPESKMTPLEKMERLTVGISKKELEVLKSRTGLDYDKLANLLSVTRATLINKLSAEKFNSSLSERILGLADIYSYGYSVFEDEDKFNRWMFKGNKALGGKTPYEICNNQFGREEVKNIIGRIEYGVYS